MVRPKESTEHFQPQPNSILVIFGELTNFILIFDLMHVLYSDVICVQGRDVGKGINSEQVKKVRNRKVLGKKIK